MKNLEEIFYNKNYSDNVILISVKQGVKARKLTKQDMSFLRKVANIDDSDFCTSLSQLLPTSTRVVDKTKTQRYLSRKKYQKLNERRPKR